MATGAEPLTEVAGDRPNVRARTAAQVHAHVDAIGRGLYGQHIDGVDTDRPRRHLDRGARARGAVRDATLVLPGAEDGRSLLERPDERGQGVANRRLRRHRRVHPLQRALGVVGRAALAKPEDRLIALATAGQLLAEARRAPDQDG